LTIVLSSTITKNMKGNINMEKQKRQTLNADKRKVIADIFQQHFEDNSKYKKQHSEAIERYNNLREQAKVEINGLVRFHQPQEDVDTIRSMINKYGE
jgi:acyl-[acyl carrier protein]--UDP-N-acetylglucosamine O-acyltransferase